MQHNVGPLKDKYPKFNFAKMWMLHWMCDHTRNYQTRNKAICDRIGVTLIEENLVQHRQRWFGHIQ